MSARLHISHALRVCVCVWIRWRDYSSIPQRRQPRLGGEERDLTLKHTHTHTRPALTHTYTHLHSHTLTPLHTQTHTTDLRMHTHTPDVITCFLKHHIYIT